MRSATTGPRPVRLPTLLHSGVLALVVTLTGVLLAGPALAEPTATPAPSTTASAIVDPGRPTARLVHGPNCSDGFVRVEVTNGTQEHAVVLTLDGTPQGSPRTLTPGEQVVLEGGELDGGATADVAVAVTGTDGAEGPVELGTYTRPSAEDCAAVGGPTTGPTPTTGAPGTPSTTPPTTSPSPTTRPSPSAPTTTSPRPTTPSPTTPSPTTPSPTAPRPVPTTETPSTTGLPCCPRSGAPPRPARCRRAAC